MCAGCLVTQNRCIISIFNSYINILLIHTAAVAIFIPDLDSLLSKVAPRNTAEDKQVSSCLMHFIRIIRMYFF